MKSILLAGILLTSAALILAVSCSKKSTDGGDGDDGTAVAQWTVMMYGAGNNNLDVSNNNTSYIIQDVQDMEKVGSQSGMNILAMVASQRTGGQAKYYRIEYHPTENPDQISSTMLQDLGSKDMSDPATLKDFMNFCKANYLASHYLLIIDDHGAGWPGSCTDEMNGAGGELTMPELKNAIAQSTLQRVDIVCFHACLMAMVEVGYELRNVADYMTASQFTMPMQNVLGADLWLLWLKDNLGVSTLDVARKIAEKVNLAAQNKQKTAHYAVMDLSRMVSLGATIGNWGNYMVTETGDYWNEVVHAWQQTNTNYDNPAYVDLREFANKVKLEEHLALINLIRNGADSVIAAVNAAVPYTSTHFQSPDQPVPRGGLNIHFPFQMAQFDSANYVTNEFRSTNWHAFLSTFLRSGAQTPTQGRCCYNNNQNCAVNTQAECGQLGGNWTEGIDCNTPCEQGVSCPTQCAQAAAYTVGQTVSQCQFTAQATQHWFYTTLNVGSFRFQLGNFPAGADYDFYTFMQCADYPNSPTTCSSEQVGPEDMTCTVSGGSIVVYILINAYQAPYGGYTFVVTQTGVAPEGGLPHIAAE